MRRILVEHARRRQRPKHGGDCQRVDLNDEDLPVEAPSDDLVALDEALTKLAEVDEAKAELMKLRYFAALTLEQAAELLDFSPTTQWTLPVAVGIHCSVLASKTAIRTGEGTFGLIFDLLVGDDVPPVSRSVLLCPSLQHRQRKVVRDAISLQGNREAETRDSLVG